jgi:hypothetical protein
MMGRSIPYFLAFWQEERQGIGKRHLRLVGLTYGCFGLGLALYFASQGA